MLVSLATHLIRYTSELWCWMHGHPTTFLRYEPNRLYLECASCGKCTPGIQIGRMKP
jgi:hypothetical protein